MSNPKELERIGNLFKAATNLSKTFLDECSKTKFLAVKDYYRAEDRYIKLAEKTLSVKSLGIAGKDDCFGCLSSVKSELESGQLDSGLVDALEDLRATYLENILRPAVKQYIHNDSTNNQGLKKLYTNALKIENLLEVIQFMNKVQTIE
ncbi:MAG: hypothetical protein RTV31_06220 [Candidatus Thorarchaeota archaeon]